MEKTNNEDSSKIGWTQHLDNGGVGISHVYEPPHLGGEVHHGAVFCDSHMVPACQWLSHISQSATGGGLVEAHHQLAGIVRLGVET